MNLEEPLHGMRVKSAVYQPDESWPGQSGATGHVLAVGTSWTQAEAVASHNDRAIVRSE